MAVEFPRLVLPPYPFGRAHWFYFADRDVGAPSVLPDAGEITSAGTTPDIDTLTWDLSDRRPLGEPNFRRADGFLVAVAYGDTAEPWLTGSIYKVSIQSRSFVMPGWPSGDARSYALAVYRNTYQGEQASGWQQPVAWKGVT